ncbi:MAG: tetratricopeptide repeat protein [Thioalkalivibrio sp.]|nr:tetratricopeptide repeat protein [Thioalkalivibrio sp.]
MTAGSHRSNRPRSADFTTPLTIPGGDAAGADLVRELPAEVALAAWQTLRSVLMWAGEEPVMRGELFEPCAMGEWERELLEAGWDPDLRCALAVLVGELAAPAEASAETLARTCLCVTEWALEHGHVATALAFAEAAALAWPQHPRFSWMAGRLLKRYGHLTEAEEWLRRAAKAASSARDWEAQALALSSLGNVLHDLGRNPQSLRMLKDALRIARRHRLRAMEGEVLHNLFVVATWSDLGEPADEYAQAAFEIYRDGHPRLPALAHDVACSWILRGFFSRALTVLKTLPSLIELPEERVKTWGSQARAAAACGEHDVFHRAVNEVWSLLEDPHTLPRSASALLEVAMGAKTIEAWDQAERAVTKAVEVASQTGEGDVLDRAQEVLAAIAERNADEAAQRLEDTRHVPYIDSLLKGFLSSLAPRTRLAV